MVLGSYRFGDGRKQYIYKINFKSEVKGKISSWVFADQELSSEKINNIVIKGEELLPAKPYPENIQKVILSIKKNKL